MGFLILMSSYGFSILMVWAGLLWLTREERAWAQWRLFFVAGGVGPLLLGRLLAFLLGWLPGRSPVFYGAGVLLALLLIGLPGLSRVRQCLAAHFNRSRIALYLREPQADYPLIVMGLFALLIVGAVALPIFAHDPLEYAQAARLIYEVRDLSIYPFVDATKGGGFYGPWTHPPGFVSLLVWSNLIQGHADFPGLIRVPPVYFSLTTSLLLWNIGGRRAGPLAVIALLTTPLFFHAGIINHVDSPRVFGILAAVALIQLCLRGPTLRYMIALGVVMGLGLYIHSIGILLIPMGALVFVHHGSGQFKRRVALFTLTTAIALAVVLPAYLANIKNVGSVVADAPPVWQIESLEYPRHMKAARKLGTPAQRWVFGIMKGWTRVGSFSFTYWWFLWALILFVRALSREFGLKSLSLKVLNASLKQENLTRFYSDWAWISLLLVGSYFAMTVLSVALGMDAFIKNDRYLLTVQPFYALFTGLVFARWLSERPLFSSSTGPLMGNEEC